MTKQQAERLEKLGYTKSGNGYLKQTITTTVIVDPKVVLVDGQLVTQLVVTRYRK
jgi:hypothetical protein